jgi:hypothetical protein
MLVVVIFFSVPRVSESLDEAFWLGFFGSSAQFRHGMCMHAGMGPRFHVVVRRSCACMMMMMMMLGCGCLAMLRGRDVLQQLFVVFLRILVAAFFIDVVDVEVFVQRVSPLKQC